MLKFIMAKNFKLYVRKYGEAAGFLFEYTRKRGVLPWSRTYSNILGRCLGIGRRDSKYYFDRGIRCLIKPIDLKNYFFRDRAWEMKQPSIDRIDPDKSYEPGNVRWIEFSENRKIRGLNHPKRRKQFDKARTDLLSIFEKLKWSVYLRRSFLRRIFKETVGHPDARLLS